MATFNFGVSDFVQLLAHAKSLYRQCRDSQGQYMKLQDEILSLRNHLENIEDHLNGGKMSLSMLPDLFELGQSCRDTLDRVEAVITQSDSLSIKSRQSVDAGEWTETELSDLQIRLKADVEALKNFYQILTTDHQFRLSNALEQVMKVVNSGQSDTLSIPTLKTALSPVKDEDQKTAWNALIAQLQELGINENIVNENDQFVSTWIRSSIERREARYSLPSAEPISSPLARAKSHSQSPTFAIPRSTPSSWQTPTSQPNSNISPQDNPGYIDTNKSLPHRPSSSTQEHAAGPTSDRPDSILVPTQLKSSIDSTAQSLASNDNDSSKTRGSHGSLPAVEPLRIQRKPYSPRSIDQAEILDETGTPNSATSPQPRYPSVEATDGTRNNNIIFGGSNGTSPIAQVGLQPRIPNARDSLPSYADSVYGTPFATAGPPSTEFPNQNHNGPLRLDQQRLLSSSHSKSSRTDFGDSDSESGFDPKLNGFSSSRTALLNSDPNQPATNSKSIPTSSPDLSKTNRDPSSDKESVVSAKFSSEIRNGTLLDQKSPSSAGFAPPGINDIHPGYKNAPPYESGPEVWCDCQLKVRQCCEHLQAHAWIAAEEQLGLCITNCRCGSMRDPRRKEELWFLRGVCLSFDGEFHSAIKCFSQILTADSYAIRHDQLLQLAALIWIGDACLCVGRPQSTIIAWTWALDCLESEILNMLNATDVRAKILVPICERLKLEVAHFHGFTLGVSSWNALVEFSPWVSATGKPAHAYAETISRRLESLKSVRPAEGARNSWIKYGPSTLIKGRLSSVLSKIMSIDVDYHTHHLLTWDPFFCVEGAIRQCEIAKVPMQSPLRQGPQPDTIRTKATGAFSYHDFSINISPERLTAMLKQPFKNSKADFIWDENGYMLCSWPLREPKLPFSYCTIRVKVVKYRRSNNLGLQVHPNVLSSRVTFEYVNFKERAAQELLTIFKSISDSMMPES